MLSSPPENRLTGVGAGQVDDAPVPPYGLHRRRRFAVRPEPEAPAVAAQEREQPFQVRTGLRPDVRGTQRHLDIQPARPAVAALPPRHERVRGRHRQRDRHQVDRHLRRLDAEMPVKVPQRGPRSARQVVDSVHLSGVNVRSRTTGITGIGRHRFDLATGDRSNLIDLSLDRLALAYRSGRHQHVQHHASRVVDCRVLLVAGLKPPVLCRGRHARVRICPAHLPGLAAPTTSLRPGLNLPINGVRHHHIIRMTLDKALPAGIGAYEGGIDVHYLGRGYLRIQTGRDRTLENLPEPRLAPALGRGASGSNGQADARATRSR